MSLIRLLGFATVVLLAMLLLHGYLWFRLVRSTTRPGRARRRLTLLTFFLALLPALAVTLRRTLPIEAAAPLDWIAYCWLGVAFYAFLALLVLEPVRLAGNLLLRRRDREADPRGAHQRSAPAGDDELMPSGARKSAAHEGDEGFMPSGARRVPRRHDEAAQFSRGRHLAAVRSGGSQCYGMLEGSSKLEPACR